MKIIILLFAFLSVANTNYTCAEYGCNYYYGLPSQCDLECQTQNPSDCCSDFQTVCLPNTSTPTSTPATTTTKLTTTSTILINTTPSINKSNLYNKTVTIILIALISSITITIIIIHIYKKRRTQAEHSAHIGDERHFSNPIYIFKPKNTNYTDDLYDNFDE